MRDLQRSRSRDRKKPPRKASSSGSDSSSLYSSEEDSPLQVNQPLALKTAQNEEIKGSWNKARREFQESARSKDPSEAQPDAYEHWKSREEQFHLDQAILRSKLRIQSNREMPVDFLAKVILIIEGKMDLAPDFLSDDYKRSYLVMSFLRASDLKTLLSEIQTFQGILPANRRFQAYWQA